MRLLGARTLLFEEFNREDSTPKYAILSHTWGSDEVTYKVMLEQRDLARSKEAFGKIDFCAKTALKDGLEFIWVDTCCIDKSSSAELSEAINSMYRWYQNAEICYAYLSDIAAGPAAGIPSVMQSRWFTRGWTLQELIAPRTLLFYSREGAELGSKAELSRAIEARTGVPVDILMGGDIASTSIAMRMSWAAQRETTRVEDLAYCLMGIFEVNIPMLYGEGDGAFIRLQEEIIRTSDDMSIFSWVDPTASFSAYKCLLAKSPSEFAHCKDVHWVRGRSNTPYQTTNRGIKIDLALTPRLGRPDEHIAILPGVVNRKLPKATIGVFVQQVGGDQFARVESEQLALLPAGQVDTSRNLPSTLFVRQKIVMESPNHSRAGGIVLFSESESLVVASVAPPDGWDGNTGMYLFDQPQAIKGPPPVTFSLTSSADYDGISITVRLDKSWGSFIQVDEGWRVTETNDEWTHRVDCRKGSQPMVKITLRRGLNRQRESILTLAVFRC